MALRAGYGRLVRHDGLGCGKFSGESVGTFINKCGIKDKVKHRNLIIPGYAAGISGNWRKNWVAGQ